MKCTIILYMTRLTACAAGAAAGRGAHAECEVTIGVSIFLMQSVFICRRLFTRPFPTLFLSLRGRWAQLFSVPARGTSFFSSLPTTFSRLSFFSHLAFRSSLVSLRIVSLSLLAATAHITSRLSPLVSRLSPLASRLSSLVRPSISHSLISHASQPI